jgi:hypothetical protein
MRVLLALMAVLALVVNPVAAAAAQVACEASVGAMSQIDPQDKGMATMPGMVKADATHKAGADPCCAHSGDGTMDGKACAQACALNCTLAVALPIAPFAVSLAVMPQASIPHPDSFGFAHDPSGLDRPPKFIA